MIIGISGKIGSGKDTVGKIIQYLTYHEWTNSEGAPMKNQAPYELKDWLDDKLALSINHHGNTWEVKKFAGKLKQIVSILTGCSVEDLESQDFKDRVIGTQWDSKGYVSTYRSMLQKLGTDCMRDRLHINVWVNALFSDYKLRKINDSTLGPINAFPNWIITDMRFPNELEAVEERAGITIRINRNFMIHRTGLKITRNPLQTQHNSETALDDAKFKYSIDNYGTIEELVEKVRKILIDAKVLNV